MLQVTISFLSPSLRLGSSSVETTMYVLGSSSAEITMDALDMINYTQQQQQYSTDSRSVTGNGI